ncbi:MAG TPA: NAD(+)/NADH kinase [Longimicrobiales bacterium]|nr:NAD(+)/NADH kinase [Longimicrobiales bacterium]
MSERPAPEVIGVVGHPRYAGMSGTVGALGAFANERGLTLQAEEDLLGLLPGAAPLEPASLDLLVTLGGDGTLLRGARLVAGRSTLVLGVNLGHLGFLTSIAPERLGEALDAVLAGDYWVDRRATLQAEVEGVPGRTFTALNDVVVHLSGMARLIRLALHVGEGDAREHVGTYSADGLILATPTGSTAYSLSAGGPIVSPGMECILATPINPHSLTVRPLVIAASTQVSISLLPPHREAILTVDGQQSVPVQDGRSVRVRSGTAPVHLVRFPGQSFFATLREKMHWATPQQGAAPESGPTMDARAREDEAGA